MPHTIRPQLRVVIVGHVDHGKSTLIGRLLHDTGSLPEGKLAELKAICARRGTDALEWSFVLDAFQAERDQAVTIDTTQIWFKTAMRDYVIIDAPGHREFLKNMVSGAAAADAAILVVDAREGVAEQTRRHAYLLHLLGLTQVGVAVNKMDLVGHDPEAFGAVRREVEAYLTSIGITASHIVPMAARHGEMVAARGQAMDWYAGKTLTEVLDSFEVAPQPVALPLRLPVQDVYRMGEERVLVGRVETGILRTGDRLLFSPTGEEATVTALRVWPHDPDKVAARAGEVIGLTLDQRIFVERGHVGSHTQNPPMLSSVFRANLFWLGRAPLRVGGIYRARFGTVEVPVTVQSIERVIDTGDLSQSAGAVAGQVPRNAVGEVTFRARDLLPVDPYADNPRLGRVVLYDGHDIAGGGALTMEGYADQRRVERPASAHIYKVHSALAPDARAAKNGHRGGVFWLTGLSGAGKSTIAMAVERALFESGAQVYVLDGDNIRHGLNADLGFSPEERAENVRRVGHVAALMADAGLIVVSAFISPYLADRERARAAAPQHFHEVYIAADLATCEDRDPKGLYKRARRGDIRGFTGVDAPYEPPPNPDLLISTQGNSVQTCVEQLLAYIRAHTALSEARPDFAEKALGI
ncbi:MAG TPA: adenylyl-sulfate kinase [Rhodospirillaceae bacterium]|jgi:bifunctional enzyme CysN/CysC|nr:adenylyl-sulfate kinase [Alphaproteobacteria bacterium]HBH27103.1 adenylyl-sulfate kinase [Rhodospirillaceae bacterium]